MNAERRKEALENLAELKRRMLASWFRFPFGHRFCCCCDADKEEGIYCPIVALYPAAQEAVACGREALNTWRKEHPEFVAVMESYDAYITSYNGGYSVLMPVAFYYLTRAINEVADNIKKEEEEDAGF